ncbi:site-specific integrase [Aureimonas sp. ME7]|uniref:tyrosine-type recombinase/integrase n=1 Tax=Aureimonas sp. ME7 TaxID=2744252 RepID=UPI0015FE3B8D|nr:site-specific integrase [Aureimonas sp. ME7]
MEALWRGFTEDKAGKAVLATMVHTWKALGPRFGPIRGDMVTIADCRAHTKARREAGIKDGTIHTELGHLRMVLLWAADHKLIATAPRIERPSKPEPKERWLTRSEVKKLIDAAEKPHMKLVMHLLLATAGRVAAVLELTWDRVDFKTRQIRLRNPDDPTKRKGRAVVPINATLMAVLTEAKEGAMSPYVVEWGGHPIKSIKKGMRLAAARAKLDGVTPHVFRHTAAVWMVESGIPMEEVAQFLGHSNPGITRRVYARFSPDYLQTASSALELDEPSDVDPTPEMEET